jgi:release factor glutamine methyltransferase
MRRPTFSGTTPEALSQERLIERLTAAGCLAAAEEADELFAAAPDPGTLESWIQRRENGEPIAWITGTIEFCGRPVHVDPGVYVPRIQTEELARRAATLLEATSRRRAADLCTGAGAVATHLLAGVPRSFVVGVDVDEAAVLCARKNRVPTVRGDLGQSLADRAFDVVTAIAPYVPTPEMKFLPSDVQRYEPRRALDGGRDGLDLLRRIAESASELLVEGGYLLVEIGGTQDDYLRSDLERHRFGDIETWTDEDDDLRGLVARLIR